MPEEEKQILEFLRSEGCCYRCCARFIGCRNLESYQNTTEFVKRFSHVNPENEGILEESCCTGCLGILQDKGQDMVVQRIIKELAEQSYDCSTFTCALTVPVSIKLREQSLITRIIKQLNLSREGSCNLQTKLQSIKDVWKWLVIPKIEAATGKTADLTTPSPFLVEVFLSYADDEKECEILFKEYGGTGEPKAKRKKKGENKFSRKSVETLMNEMHKVQLENCFKNPLIKPTGFVNVENVMCSHNSIFIGGRYNKFSRELCQTPWYINGEKKMDTSVQDLLCNSIAECVKAQTIKFLSSGREDVDVRNINCGRPFAVELVDPRMTNITEELLSELVRKINESSKLVQITSNLKILSKADLKKLKEGENAKTKFYRALCVCRSRDGKLPKLEILKNLKNVKIVQKTPVRVLHRRPLSPRTRFIYKMRARWAKAEELQRILQTVAETADMFFVLDVKTQAGTYVKEFVHGDFGRTTPSLSDLLNSEVDIVALDVTGIDLTWP